MESPILQLTDGPLLMIGEMLPDVKMELSMIAEQTSDHCYYRRKEKNEY